jgi:hypothetical protein
MSAKQDADRRYPKAKAGQLIASLETHCQVRYLVTTGEANYVTASLC